MLLLLIHNNTRFNWSFCGFCVRKLVVGGVNLPNGVVSTMELHMYTASTFGGDDENKDSTSGKEKRITKFVILDIVVIEQSIL